jgi:hypothetical protein
MLSPTPAGPTLNPKPGKFIDTPALAWAGEAYATATGAKSNVISHTIRFFILISSPSMLLRFQFPDHQELNLLLVIKKRTGRTAVYKKFFLYTGEGNLTAGCKENHAPRPSVKQSCDKTGTFIPSYNYLQMIMIVKMRADYCNPL